MEDSERHLPEAHAGLCERDPDDAHPQALARSLSVPLWSNNRDLGGHDVECFTTAQLMSALQG